MGKAAEKSPNKSKTPVTKSARYKGKSKTPSPSSYWVLDKVREEALKYTSRADFQRGSNGAYDASWRYDWLNEVCSHMTQIKLPNGHLNRETCHQIALKFKTRGEFRRKEGSAYGAACRKGFLNEICTHMPAVVRLHWNKESCHKAALKHKTRSEFEQGHSSAYKAAIKFDWLEEVCAHMSMSAPKYKTTTVAPGHWTNNKGNCHMEALKFGTRGEFKKKSCSAYHTAWKNGWLEEVCSHMTETHKPNGYWNNKEVCRQEALKCTSWMQFEEKSRAAYLMCCRNKWLDDVCSHMQPAQRQEGVPVNWADSALGTIDACRQEALRFSTCHAFCSSGEVAYRVARENGWQDGVCGHMPRRAKSSTGEGRSPTTTLTSFTEPDDWCFNSNEASSNLRLPEDIDTPDFDLCAAMAKRFSTRLDFYETMPAVFKAAGTNGWLSETCAHMGDRLGDCVKPMDYWDDIDNCLNEAMCYESTLEFKLDNPRAFNAACRHGWIDSTAGIML